MGQPTRFDKQKKKWHILIWKHFHVLPPLRHMILSSTITNPKPSSFLDHTSGGFIISYYTFGEWVGCTWNTRYKNNWWKTLISNRTSSLSERFALLSTRLSSSISSFFNNSNRWISFDSNTPASSCRKNN